MQKKVVNAEKSTAPVTVRVASDPFSRSMEFLSALCKTARKELNVHEVKEDSQFINHQRTLRESIAKMVKCWGLRETEPMLFWSEKPMKQWSRKDQSWIEIEGWREAILKEAEVKGRLEEFLELKNAQWGEEEKGKFRHVWNVSGEHRSGAQVEYEIRWSAQGAPNHEINAIRLTSLKLDEHTIKWNPETSIDKLRIPYRAYQKLNGLLDHLWFRGLNGLNMSWVGVDWSDAREVQKNNIGWTPTELSYSYWHGEPKEIMRLVGDLWVNGTVFNTVMSENSEDPIQTLKALEWSCLPERGQEMEQLRQKELAIRKEQDSLDGQSLSSLLQVVWCLRYYDNPKHDGESTRPYEHQGVKAQCLEKLGIGFKVLAVKDSAFSPHELKERLEDEFTAQQDQAALQQALQVQCFGGDREDQYASTTNKRL